MFVLTVFVLTAELFDQNSSDGTGCILFKLTPVEHELLVALTNQIV
jgi:hypothetical protein